MHVCGVRGENQGVARTNGAQYQDTPSPVNARSVSVRCVITNGVTADCAKAGEFIAKSCFEFRMYTVGRIVSKHRSRKLPTAKTPKI